MLSEINNCITRDSLEILHHRGREHRNEDEDGGLFSYGTYR